MTQTRPSSRPPQSTGLQYPSLLMLMSRYSRIRLPKHQVRSVERPGLRMTLAAAYNIRVEEQPLEDFKFFNVSPVQAPGPSTRRPGLNRSFSTITSSRSARACPSLSTVPAAARKRTSVFLLLVQQHKYREKYANPEPQDIAAFQCNDFTCEPLCLQALRLWTTCIRATGVMRGTSQLLQDRGAQRRRETRCRTGAFDRYLPS
ncbi:hypothetical protein B0H15DRAFT_987512 [Mycena belliarum]|uniref:Uncharacterized protein n=1 Tax=Mycena belliarum TaxID=1033014 RepID=A0AAD6U2Q1_9AGAR|nr:hypothetical protein B0H15DRAFT_987512 [Mycena belliae]